jgi:PAS domain S-box-containing protein
MDKLLLIEQPFASKKVCIFEDFGYEVISSGLGPVSADRPIADLLTQAAAVVLAVHAGQGRAAVEIARGIYLLRDVPLLFLVDDCAADELDLFLAFPNASLVSATAHPRFWQHSLQALCRAAGEQATAGQSAVEAALRDNEARLSLALDIADLASWEYNAQSDELILNDRFYKIYGTTVAREGGYRMRPQEYVSRFVYSDDRERVVETFTSPSPFTQPSVMYYLEHRILRGDGLVRWVAVRLNILADPGRQYGIGVVQDITERIQAVSALRASEERYRLLFENMQEGFALFEALLDEQGSLVDFRFLDVNRAYELQSRRKRADIIGRRASELVPGVDPELLRLHGKEILTGQPLTFEYHFALFDRYVRVHIFRPQPGQFATIFEDVSQARKTEIALRESELVRIEANERFRSLFEQNHDAVFILDFDGQHLAANQRAADMLGYPLEELLTLSVKDISGELEQSRDIITRLFAGEHIPLYERLFRKKDGSPLPVEINVELVRDKNGAPQHVQSVVRDISQRKQAEEAIKKLLAEKELLMREVHHRIKNNMSTISGLLSLQAFTLKDPAAVEALMDAESRVRSMMTIYDRLYRSGNYLALDAAAFLSSLLNDIAQTWSTPAGGVALTQEVEDLPIETGISFPLGIILNECITNAYKYAFPAGRSGTICVSLHQVGDCLEAVVADDGVGLSAEIDLEDTLSFGLKLVTMMARQLNARLTIDRSGGTRFTFSIPLSREVAA